MGARSRRYALAKSAAPWTLGERGCGLQEGCGRGGKGPQGPVTGLWPVENLWAANRRLLLFVRDDLDVDEGIHLFVKVHLDCVCAEDPDRILQAHAVAIDRLAELLLHRPGDI